MPRQHTNYVRDTYDFPADFPADFPQRLRRWRDGGGQPRSVHIHSPRTALAGHPVGKES